MEIKIKYILIIMALSILFFGCSERKKLDINNDKREYRKKEEKKSPKFDDTQQWAVYINDKSTIK